MPRHITVQVRIACPRLYEEKSRQRVISVEKCQACSYHKEIKNLSPSEIYVICEYPAKYNKSRRKKKHEPW